MRPSNPSPPKATFLMVFILALIALFSFTLGLKLGKTINETKPMSQESLACAQTCKETPAPQTVESNASTPLNDPINTTNDQANTMPDNAPNSPLPPDSTQERVNQ